LPVQSEQYDEYEKYQTDTFESIDQNVSDNDLKKKMKDLSLKLYLGNIINNSGNEVFSQYLGKNLFNENGNPLFLSTFSQYDKDIAEINFLCEWCDNKNSDEFLLGYNISIDERIKTFKDNIQNEKSSEIVYREKTYIDSLENVSKLIKNIQDGKRLFPSNCDIIKRYKSAVFIKDEDKKK